MSKKMTKYNKIDVKLGTIYCTPHTCGTYMKNISELIIPCRFQTVVNGVNHCKLFDQPLTQIDQSLQRLEDCKRFYD